MSLSKLIKTTFLIAAVASVYTAYAQGRPGIDRPIRVGQFRGTGTGTSYWHENIHQSAILLNTILSTPTPAILGDSLVVPTHNPPFTYTSFGVVTANSSTPSGTAKTPTVAQTNAFLAALDTLDVAIISCMVNFETVLTTSVQREALLSFVRRKGYLAVHATTDTQGGWAQGDSIHGTAFRGHPNTDRVGTLRRDSVFETEADWKYLNRSLFTNGLDTSFQEEWFFFTTSASAIRSQANLKPTVKLIEASLAGGLGGQTAMGDHPHSWYRHAPDSGGRTFYTAVGHRPNLWNTNAQAPRFFRRQLYNAILWLAKYDSATVSIQPNKANVRAADMSRLTIAPSELTVTMLPTGDHTVELLSVDGKRVAFKTGSGNEQAYRFTGLRTGVYALSMSSNGGRASRLVTIP